MAVLGRPILRLRGKLGRGFLVPTFAFDTNLGSAGNLIVIIGILASARFVLALAGLDIGTSLAASVPAAR